MQREGDREEERERERAQKMSTRVQPALRGSGPWILACHQGSQTSTWNRGSSRYGCSYARASAAKGLKELQENRQDALEAPMKLQCRCRV